MNLLHLGQRDVSREAITPPLEDPINCATSLSRRESHNSGGQPQFHLLWLEALGRIFAEE